jgi:methyl-accepting chemotaxis protein
VAETSAAMAEMAAANDLVRDKSRQAGALTESLSRQGEGGGQAVRETSEAIAGIHHASQEVLQVLGALKKIAADTNLLAMNAAIEAAHAGEKGAGFAVVADEVRKLANTASNQTKTIKDLILAMARQVESGVARAQASGAVLSDLVKGLQDSAQVSQAVVEAMEEQSVRTAGVGDALTQVVGTTGSIQTKMTAQDRTTAEMNETLGRAVEKLSTLIETSQRQAEAVASLEASFAEVRREVDRNAEAAEKLQAEIGRFQV